MDYEYVYIGIILEGMIYVVLKIQIFMWTSSTLPRLFLFRFIAGSSHWRLSPFDAWWRATFRFPEMIYSRVRTAFKCLRWGPSLLLNCRRRIGLVLTHYQRWAVIKRTENTHRSHMRKNPIEQENSEHLVAYIRSGWNYDALLIANTGSSVMLFIKEVNRRILFN